MIVGYKMNERDERPLISKADAGQNVGRVEEVIRFIESQYVDDIPVDDVVDASIRAAMDELDPHSLYLNRDQMTRVNEEMGGAYRGIGIETYYIKDTVHVILAAPDGPADRAGVRSFDKIIAINDTIVAGRGLPFADIRNRLRGDAGQDISLQVLRADSLLTLHTKVADLPYHSVSSAYMLNESTAVIGIDRFSTKTYEEFMSHLEGLVEDKKAKNIIIDLRGNPGGILPDATKILSQLFVEKGNMLVYTEGKNGRKNEYTTSGKPFYPIQKVVVLIDENSASGSEIMAGAIQDWDRGLIVGRRSFGKGLVQEQYDLRDGSAIRLTVARYYTPSGRSIQKDYTSKSGYDGEIDDRYYNGELFDRDSIATIDSLTYRTKILGRPIYGGGGITPDIFVAMDSSRVFASYREIINAIPRFTYTYLANHPAPRFDSAEQFTTNYTVPDAMLTALARYMPSQSPRFEAQSIQRYDTEIRRHLRFSVGRITYGNGKVESILNEDDPFINAALPYLNDKISLQDIEQ